MSSKRTTPGNASAAAEATAATSSLQDVTKSLRDIQERRMGPLLRAATHPSAPPLRAAQARAGIALMLATVRYLSGRVRNGTVLPKSNPLRQDLDQMRKLVTATMKKKPPSEKAAAASMTNTADAISSSPANKKTEPSPASSAITKAINDTKAMASRTPPGKAEKSTTTTSSESTGSPPATQSNSNKKKKKKRKSGSNDTVAAASRPADAVAPLDDNVVPSPAKRARHQDQRPRGGGSGK